MNLAQNPTEKRKVLFYTLGLFVMYKLSSNPKYYDFMESNP